MIKIVDVRRLQPDVSSHVFHVPEFVKQIRIDEVLDLEK